MQPPANEQETGVRVGNGDGIGFAMEEEEKRAQCVRLRAVSRNERVGKIDYEERGRPRAQKIFS